MTVAMYKRHPIGPAKKSVAFAGWRAIATMNVWLMFVAAPDLHAHLALRGSAPAADGSLHAAPTSIQLSFTEPVELALSSVILTGPDGQIVLLGELATVEARDVITAPITGQLKAGTYTVAWQAVGRDGHPVQGEFAFVIEEGATGLAPPVEEIPVGEPIDMEPTAVPAAELPSFNPQSPLYAAVRWLGYVGILGSLGAIGFAVLLSAPRLRSDAVTPSFREAAAAGAASLGIFSALLLGFSLPLRLQAQAHSLFGGGVTRERFGLLLDSTWGLAWVAQAVGAALLLGGLILARRGVRPGWLLAGIGAIGLAAAPGLSGHAAAVERLRGVAVTADALHILGVGAWLGTLVVLQAVGVPLARKQPQDVRGELLGRLLNAFSPLALLAAGVVLGTGVLASFLHLSAPSDLWASAYGRVLAAKVLLVLSVMAFGAFNWRRVGPRAAEPGADRRLMKSAGAELATAVVIVALTAVLVALPAPGHSETAATPVAGTPSAGGDLDAAVDLAGQP